MTRKTYRSYIFGIILSIVLAGWIAIISMSAITDPSLGWGILLLINVASLFGGPLAGLLLIVWLIYMVRDRGRVPARIHALLFLPSLFAIMIYPFSQYLAQRQHDQFRAANPPIAETHVNLSGRELWIDARPYASGYDRTTPSTPLSAGQSERFITFTRYPSSDFVATGAFPYEGERLKEGLAQYEYQTATDNTVTSLPMNRLSYPDTTPFHPVLGKNGASMLRYIYFHYSDHVDVAPALHRLSWLTKKELEEKNLTGLVLLNAHNYTPHAITRLEINSQTLDIGEQALKSTPPLPQSCTSYTQQLGAAFLDLNQPLDIRWQTLNEPTIWHTATLDVPAFRSVQPIDSESTLLRVKLYFLPDGTVESERFVKVQLPEELIGIRATGMPARAANFASCGSAFNGFDPKVARLLLD